MTEIVLVVGAGRMGMQIGLEYAMAGFSVHLVSKDHDSLRRRFQETMDRWGQLIPTDRAALATIHTRTKLVTQIDPSLKPNIIVESLPEDMQLKSSLLKPLVAAHRSAIVASNTSSLDITELAASINAPTRTIGVHYLNPPYLNPLVEITPTKETSQVTLNRMVDIIRSVGKHPILVSLQLPGFVWNRLQFALLREAVDLVERGVVSPVEIDLIMKLGLGRRWRAVGLFESVLLGGAPTFVAAAPRILESLSDRQDIDDLSRIIERLNLDSDSIAWFEILSSLMILGRLATTLGLEPMSRFPAFVHVTRKEPQHASRLHRSIRPHLVRRRSLAR